MENQRRAFLSLSVSVDNSSLANITRLVWFKIFQLKYILFIEGI
jgi:hypothetical protein